MRPMPYKHRVGESEPADRDMKSTLDGLLAGAMRAVGADTAAFYLDDPERGAMVLSAGRNVPSDALGHEIEPGEGLVGRVAQERRSALATDVPFDPRAVPRRPDWDDEPVVRSFLGVPLRTGPFVIGVLELTSAVPNAFSVEHRGLASVLADAAALLIEQTRLTSEPPPAALTGTPLPEDDPIAVVTLDRRQRITSANPAFSRLVGLPVEAMIDRPVVAILPALGRPRARDALAASLHGAAGRLSGVQSRTEGGREAVLSMSLIPMGTPSGGVEGVMLVVQDVSERIRLEEELRLQHSRALEAQERLRAVIEVVSHELRTPLTSVLGYARLLHDRPDSPAERRVHWAELVTDKARMMARQVDEVTELARLGSEHFTLHLAKSNVADIVRSAAEEIDRESDRHSVVVKADEHLPLLALDRDRMSQVMTNLLTNAVKFWPEGGTIEIAVEGEPGAVRVDVVDRGPGVPREEAEKIFEPFYRVQDEATRAVPGTGLGLAVSRGIVEAHGGRLWVDPVPGGGSCFRMVLPEAGPREQPVAAE